MSKKHAEARPSLNEWVVHHNGSVKPLAIAASRLLRDQYGGYTFTGPDGIIADFPPGTVSYVTRKPPAPPGVFPLPASLGVFSLSPNQMRELQDALYALTGAKVQVLPPGSKVAGDDPA